MAIRTVTDTVPLVTAPPSPPELAVLEAALEALRARFPGALFHRYRSWVPTIDPDAWVAPGAVLIGDVRLGPQVSIWPGCVLRADLAHIEIGARSNLQDGTIVHLGDHDPTVVGEDVVVGHRAVLHGCTIGDACLIGIGSTILDGAHIGLGSVIGAGALVPAARVVPPASLVLGVPGQVTKTLEPAAADFHRALAAKYTRLAHNHRRG